MKIILTESQYKIIEDYINEARTAPVPTNLSSLFNKNKDTTFFDIVQKLKDGQENPYTFKFDREGGFLRITDINPGTPTRGCSIDANLDTMIYDNEFNKSFGGNCNGKSLSINNIIKIVLYDKDKNKLDELSLLNTSNTDLDVLIDRYNDMLKGSNNGDEVFFDGSKQYDGTVYNKSENGFEIELSEHNSNKPSMILYIETEVDEQHFYSEKGNVKFKAKRRKTGSNNEDMFIMDIKRFSKSTVSKDEKQDGNPNPVKIDGMSDEEIRDEASKAIEMIINDPELKTAFYKKPNFWNLFMGELKGKKSPGKGILPTLQILNSYGQNKLSEKIGKIFVKDKPILFVAYEKPISITFTNTKGGKEVFTIGVTEQEGNKAWLRDYSIGDSTYVLENTYTDILISVKNKTDITDVYYCKVIKYVESSTGGRTEFPSDDNIMIRFLRTSDGYKPENKE